MEKKTIIWLISIVIIGVVAVALESAFIPPQYKYDGYAAMPIEQALQIAKEQGSTNNNIVAVSDSDTVYLSYYFIDAQQDLYGLDSTGYYVERIFTLFATCFLTVLLTYLICINSESD
jgi:hypothetical protein